MITGPKDPVPTRISHQLRREAKKSAVDSRCSDRRPPEAYLTYGEDGRSENAAKMQCFSTPQQMAGEKCGLRRLGHPAIEALAKALESGRLTPPFSLTALGRHLPYDLTREVQAELEKMTTLGMTPTQMAYHLKAVAQERAQNQAQADRLELVWSGTERKGSMSRDTAVVVKDLFASAKKSVLVASYAVDPNEKAKTVFAPLAQNMDQNPNLNVRLFLNVHRKYQDQTQEAALLRQFAETFRNNIWPGKRLPEVFHDPRSLALGGDTRACLHAKCIVADQDQVLITSANFTEAAHQRNIEAGVLLKNIQLATALRAQFDSLVTRKALTRIPGLSNHDTAPKGGSES